jgi:hypothetical protein
MGRVKRNGAGVPIKEEARGRFPRWETTPGQHEPLFLGLHALHRGVIRQDAARHPFLWEETALELVGAWRLDHRLGEGVDALWLKQHPTAELQLPHHADEFGLQATSVGPARAC